MCGFVRSVFCFAVDQLLRKKIPGYLSRDKGSQRRVVRESDDARADVFGNEQTCLARSRRVWSKIGRVQYSPFANALQQLLLLLFLLLLQFMHLLLLVLFMYVCVVMVVVVVVGVV